MKQILIILLCVFTVGCKCKKNTQQIFETRTETIIQKDTVFRIRADTSQYIGNLTVKDAKIYLEEIKHTTGKETPLQKPRVKLQNNQLLVDCYLDEQKLYAKWKEKHSNSQKTIIKEVAVAKPLTFWQKLLMYTGGISLVIIAGWLVKQFYIK